MKEILMLQTAKLIAPTDEKVRDLLKEYDIKEIGILKYLIKKVRRC